MANLFRIWSIPKSGKYKECQAMVHSIDIVCLGLRSLSLRVVDQNLMLKLQLCTSKGER